MDWDLAARIAIPEAIRAQVSRDHQQVADSIWDQVCSCNPFHCQDHTHHQRHALLAICQQRNMAYAAAWQMARQARRHV